MIKRVCFISLLAGLAMFANAQTPGCVATQIMVSPSQGVAPQPSGWQITQLYQTVFTTADLATPAFPAGATLGSTALASPLFGCTADGQLWLQVFGQDGTATVMRRDNTGIWVSAFSNKFGGGSFPNPGNGLLGVGFVKATQILTQGNRIVVLGQFGGIKPLWRAYDIGTNRAFVFDFRGIHTDSITQACVTNSGLWFMVNIGDLTQVFGVDTNGKLSLVPEASIPGLNASATSTITMTCYANSVGLEVVSADRSSSASYILADTRK